MKTKFVADTVKVRKKLIGSGLSHGLVRAYLTNMYGEANYKETLAYIVDNNIEVKPMILMGFQWHLTPEGEDFWGDVSDFKITHMKHEYKLGK
jgi:hypothetical protein